jgi:glycopeptide antibiotics resistance protein
VIQRAIRRIVLAVYLAVVLTATLAPLSGGMYVAVAGLDKLVHLCLFAGVAFLVYWAQKSAGEPLPGTAVILASGLAGLIELIQSLLQYRSGDVWDFLAGALGAIFGAAAAVLSAALKHRLYPNPP